MPIHVSISEKKEEGPGLGEVQLSLCTLFFFFMCPQFQTTHVN